MSRWFRFYDDAMWHPKVLSLRDSEFRTWAALLCLASREKAGGFLPDEVTIGKSLSIKAATIRQQTSKLIATGLLLRDGDRLRIHNWEKHQYKSDVSSGRMRRLRAKSDVTVTAAVTAPETESEKNKGSVPNGTAAGAAVQGDLLSSQNSLRPPINGGTVSVGEKEKKEDPKKEVFDLGKAVLGRGAGGQIAKLLRHYGGEDDPRAIAQAMAALWEAKTKANPAEWIGRVLAPRKGPEKTATDPWGNPVEDWRNLVC